MADSLKGDGRMIFTIFVGAIIAIVFMASIGDQIFTQTNTASNTNLTVTVLAINSSLAIEGRDLLTVVSITNVTNSSLDTNGLNLTSGVLNGVKTVFLVANDSSGSVGNEVNLSYTYNPDGYITSAGGRSITALILIISALAILVFVVVVMFKFGSIQEIMNMRRRK